MRGYGATVDGCQGLKLPQLKHAGAAVLGVVCVCYGALLLALRQQISTVVAIVTEATVVVGAMPSLLPFPLLTLAALLGVYGYAAVVGAYLLTAAPTVADVASLEGRCEDTVEGIGRGTNPTPTLSPSPSPKPQPRPSSPHPRPHSEQVRRRCRGRSQRHAQPARPATEPASRPAAPRRGGRRAARYAYTTVSTS